MKTDSRCHVKGFSGSRRCGAEALDTGSYFLLCNPKGLLEVEWLQDGLVQGRGNGLAQQCEIQPALP